MSIDFLPNRASGPLEREMASNYAARRARLWSGGVAEQAALPKPRPLSPFSKTRMEEQIEAAVAAAVAAGPPVEIPAWRKILMQVSEKHGVPLEVIVGFGRSKDIVPARYEAAYRMVTELGMSLPAAGRRLNRDHTTILHGVRRHLQMHPELRQVAIDQKEADVSVREEFEQEVIRRYFDKQEGATNIARQLGVNRDMVNTIVRREVVRIRQERQAGQSL